LAGKGNAHCSLCETVSGRQRRFRSSMLERLDSIQQLYAVLLAQMLAQPVAVLNPYDHYDALPGILFRSPDDLLEEVLVPALPPLFFLRPVESVLE